MTIRVGKLTPIYERIIAVKKGEVSKVRACYRKLCRIFQDEVFKDRFIMYLVSEGRAYIGFSRGDILMYPSHSNCVKREYIDLPENSFTEAEITSFSNILSIYDYFDEVTADSIDGAEVRRYVRLKYSSLFSEGLLNRVLSFFTDFFDRFRS